MPRYQYEAMDATGNEIKDVIDAPNEEEAQATIRQMGYFVTKLSEKKSRAEAAKKKGKKPGKSFALGKVKSKILTTFTRQLSILQDAGLPILRSLRVLEGQCKGGQLKNALIDVCDEIESGSTLSEAMSKSPKAFNRLYVNMIKAGEAGGALEVILRRLSEFLERSESLKRKVKGALIYPICVVIFASLILAGILWKIVPTFEKIFIDFDTDMPVMTVMLIDASHHGGQLFLLVTRHTDLHLAVPQAGLQVQTRPLWLGPLCVEASHLRPIGRKEHRGPNHADPGYPGGQRRTHPRGFVYYQRDGRKRRFRADLRPSERGHSRG